jgi:hypothetical protein
VLAQRLLDCREHGLKRAADRVRGRHGGAIHRRRPDRRERRLHGGRSTLRRSSLGIRLRPRDILSRDRFAHLALFRGRGLDTLPQRPDRDLDLRVARRRGRDLLDRTRGSPRHRLDDLARLGRGGHGAADRLCPLAQTDDRGRPLVATRVTARWRITIVAMATLLGADTGSAHLWARPTDAARVSCRPVPLLTLDSSAELRSMGRAVLYVMSL